MSASAADREYMRISLKTAEGSADNGEVPVGAVIVRNSDGFIAGKGRNTRETCRTALGHAEINAIAEACEKTGGWRLRGYTLYVTLEPCPMCAGAAVSAGIDRIVFGAYDKKNGACGSVINLCEENFTVRPEVCGGVMEEECSALLKKFFGQKRLSRRSLRFSPIVTDDQRSRAAAVLSISPERINEDIRRGYVYDFIRKNGKVAGVISYGSGEPEIFILNEYKAYVSQEEVKALFYENGRLYHPDKSSGGIDIISSERL